MSEENKTEVYSGDSWADPVDQKANLPDPATTAAGTMCFVRKESRLYVVKDGAWVVEMEKPDSPRD